MNRAGAGEERAAQSGSARRRWIASLLWAVWISLLVVRGVEGLQEAQILMWEFISAGWVFRWRCWCWFCCGCMRGRIAGRFAGFVSGCLTWVFVWSGWCRHWWRRALAVSLTMCRALRRRWQRRSRDIGGSCGCCSTGCRTTRFAHRWPGWEVPNFDRLRSQSATFLGASGGAYRGRARSGSGRQLPLRRGYARVWKLFSDSRRRIRRRFAFC